MNQIRELAVLPGRILTVMQAATAPMHVNDVFDKPYIREVCSDKNKVSITLSDLCRAGKLTRSHCVVPGTNIKFAYSVATEPVVRRKHTPKPSVEVVEQVEAPVIDALKRKPQITVEEHQVIIELATIKIVVSV